LALTLSNLLVREIQATCQALREADRMTSDNPSDKQSSGSPLNKQTIGAMLLTAAAAPLANAAIQQAAKIPQAMAARRSRPKLRNEAIYHHVYKARVIGEAALSLDSEGSDDERQRMVTDSTTLRNALHDQLAALRVSYAGQQSDVLDAAQTAAKDVDRLVAALNKWALSPSGAGQAQALEQAVQAVDASENALLSRMGKTQRRFKITFPGR
jgi:hypothetical protein